MNEEIRRQIIAYIQELSQIGTELNQQITQHKTKAKYEKVAKEFIFSGIAKDIEVPVKYGRMFAEALPPSQMANSLEFINIQNKFFTVIGTLKAFIRSISIENKSKQYENGERYALALETEMSGKQFKQQIQVAIKFLRKLAMRNLEYTTKIAEATKPKYTYIFDSQIFDRILDGNIDVNVLEASKKKGSVYYITHIQVDEINKCSDVDRRGRLILLMQKIGSVVVPTESFIPGTSRLGFGKMSDAKLFEDIKGTNPKNSEDALIGETAMKANITLVSDDKKLMTKVKELGGRALSSSEFLSEIKNMS